MKTDPRAVPVARSRLRRFVGLTFVTVALAFLLGRSMETPQWREDKAREDVAFWTQVLKNYCEDNGRCPTTEEGLATLAREGYLRQPPTDPWGRPFGYVAPGPGGEPFELWSTGPDGNGRLGLR